MHTADGVRAVEDELRTTLPEGALMARAAACVGQACDQGELSPGCDAVTVPSA